MRITSVQYIVILRFFNKKGHNIILNVAPNDIVKNITLILLYYYDCANDFVRHLPPL